MMLPLEKVLQWADHSSGEIPGDFTVWNESTGGFMNLRIVAGLVIAAGLMVGCGTTTLTPETQGSKPVTTRAQSYNPTFASKYVDIVLGNYNITNTTFGLDQTRANAINSLVNGQTTPSALRDSLLNPLVGLNIYWRSSNSSLGSPENFADFLYQHYLVRNDDGSGRAYWASMLRNGMTPSQVRDAFIDSQEYALRFPQEQFVGSLYANILRRSASAAEIQAWANFLNAGGTSRSNAIRFFLDSAEFSNCQFLNPYYYTFEIIWTKASGFVYPGPFPPARLSCN
jgi:Domain of unknown function (DUF4214)